MNPMNNLLRRKVEGRGFYHTWESDSSLAGFRTLCGLLARDEKEHEKALRALSQGEAPQLEDGSALNGAKNLLRRIFLEDLVPTPSGTELKRLGQAMAYEASCLRICRELAGSAGEGTKRDLLLTMAAQEEIHFTLLEEMCDLVGEKH